MKIWVNRKHYDFKYMTFNPIDLSCWKARLNKLRDQVVAFT
jgi:hypothetical protein